VYFKNLFIKQNYYFFLSSLIFVVSFFLFLPPTHAASISWSGNAGDGKWETATNWTGSTTPVSADDVTINTATTVSLNASTPIHSLVIGNSGGTIAAILNFNYDAVASGTLAISGNLTLYSAAQITHSAGTSVAIGKIKITVGGNATITGNINTDYKGFASNQGTGVGQTGAITAGGASYGGIGGTSADGWVGGTSYGSSTAPTDIGSGGGAATNCGTTVAGSGGGAVILNVTGTTTISGIISAIGGDGSGCWAQPGGSGGSIYITTGTLAGSGTLNVRGGNGNSSHGGAGAGAGGRIALIYTTDSSSYSYSLFGGNNGSGTGNGGSGTFFKKSGAQSYGDLTIDNNSLGSSNESLFGYTPIGSQILDSVIVKNSGSLYLTASSATSTTLTLQTNGHYRILGGTTLNYTTFNWTNGILTNSGGNFALTNSNAALSIPSTDRLVDNIYNESLTYSSVTINGTVNHSANSTYPNSNLYKINWTVSGSLTIGSGGTINADSRGYASDQGPGVGQNGTQTAGGASYGGVGGASGDGNTAGVTYGSSTAPTNLGSGGGAATNCNTTSAGAGGGAVILNVTGTTTISGSISVNGGTGSSCWDQSGGSGGSIYIITGGIAGTGSLSAIGGGASFTHNGSGSGGGGRIAVTYNANGANITRTVSGGTTGFQSGSAGTLIPSTDSTLTTQGATSITSSTSTGNASLQTLGWLQVNEFGIAWSAYNNPTNPNSSISSPSYGSATSSNQNLGFASNAFDEDTSTIWASNAGLPYDLEYDISTTTVVNKYKFTSSPSSAVGDTPSTWKFQGYNGSSWTDLDSQAGQSGWSNTETRTYTFTNTTTYPKYRIHITANNSGATTRLAELQMFDTNSNKLASALSATPGAFNIALTGLTGSTLYHYRPYAISTNGAIYGPDQTFTSAASNNNPNTPSSLGPSSVVSGTFISGSTPNFTFNITDSDATDTVQSRIQISTTSNYSTLVVDYTSALTTQGAVSFTVGQATSTGAYNVGYAGQTLTDGSYYWQVKGIDNSGGSSSYNPGNSGAIAFRIDVTPPIPGSITLSSTTTTSITPVISGSSDATSGLAASPYSFNNITRGNGSGTTSATSWLSSGLTPNTQYTFSATVYDANNNSSTTPQVSAYTLANIPSSLTASSTGSGQITVSWNANSNPSGTQYFAENINDSSNSGWITTTSYTFSSLTCGTSYSFHVRAQNASSTVTNYSSSTSQSTQSCNSAPNNPTSLGPTSATSGQWVSSNSPTFNFSLSDPDVADQVKYEVQISTSSSFTGFVVDYTSALSVQGVFSFTVGQSAGSGSYTTGQAAQRLSDTSYYWRVKALDGSASSSSYTNGSVGVAFMVDTTGPTSGSLSLSSAASDSIKLQFSVSGDSGSGLASTPYSLSELTTNQNYGNSASLIWVVNNLISLRTYIFQITSTDAVGNTTNSTSLSVTTSGSGVAIAPSYFEQPTGPFSVNIDNTNKAINSHSVNLLLVGGSNVAKIALSNENQFINSSLRAFTPKLSNWDFCLGITNCNLNDVHTIYVKFYTSGGQQSPVFSVDVSATTAIINFNQTTNNASAPKAQTATTPTPTKKIVFLSYLHLGSKGKEVINLQNYLLQTGFLKTVSKKGVYDAKLVQAVKNFQKNNGLDPIGVVGPSTRKLLNSLIKVK
jgi:hypothetical protein